MYQENGRHFCKEQDLHYGDTTLKKCLRKAILVTTEVSIINVYLERFYCCKIMKTKFNLTSLKLSGWLSS